MKIVVLIVSDRCSAGLYQDKSGPALTKLLSDWYPKADIEIVICADDFAAIKNNIQTFANVINPCDIILTSGGTGLSKRDITSDVVKQMLDKEALGISLTMLMGSLKITPFAALSRPCCGVINQSLILTLPGSLKGSCENLVIIGKDVIDHAIFEIKKQLPYPKDHFNDNLHINSCHCGKDERNLTSIKVDPARKSAFVLFDENVALSTIFEEICVMKFDDLIVASYLNDDKIHSENFAHETIISNLNIPPKPISIKDGYAINSSGNDRLRLVIGISSPGKLFEHTSLDTLNSVVQVSTGSAIPEGLDAVVQIEDTELVERNADGTEKCIKLASLPPKGQDIRPVGSDLRAGQLVLERQQKISPQVCALLVSIGVQEVRVFKSPLVGILSTGDEIVDSNQPLDSMGTKIYDSNRYMLAGLLRKFKYRFLDLGIVPDDPNAITTKLKDALNTCDVIISTGSVSMGEKDYVKNVIVKNLGGTIHFGRVFVKPGMPTTFATIPTQQRDCLRVAMFALPGNPVSAFATFHIFVLPALAKMKGDPNYNNLLPCLKAVLEEELVLDQRPEYVRGILRWNVGQNFNAPYEGSNVLPRVVSTSRNQMSSCLASTVGANCLIKCPPKTDLITKLIVGDVVDVIYID